MALIDDVSISSDMEEQITTMLEAFSRREGDTDDSMEERNEAYVEEQQQEELTSVTSNQGSSFVLDDASFVRIPSSDDDNTSNNEHHHDVKIDAVPGKRKEEKEEEEQCWMEPPLPATLADSVRLLREVIPDSAIAHEELSNPPVATPSPRPAQQQQQQQQQQPVTPSFHEQQQQQPGFFSSCGTVLDTTLHKWHQQVSRLQQRISHLQQQQQRLPVWLNNKKNIFLVVVALVVWLFPLVWMLVASGRHGSSLALPPVARPVVDTVGQCDSKPHENDTGNSFVPSSTKESKEKATTTTGAFNDNMVPTGDDTTAFSFTFGTEFPRKPETVAEALAQAKTYERKLLLPQASPVHLLNDLVRGGIWEEWAHFTKRSNYLLSLFFVPKDKKDLKLTCANIQKHLLTLLREMLSTLMMLLQDHDEDRSNDFFRLQSSLNDSAPTLLAYFELMNLHALDAPLMKAIVAELGPDLESIEYLLAHRLQRLRATMLESVYDTPLLLCETLHFSKTSPLLRAAKEYSHKKKINLASNTTIVVVDHAHLVVDAKNRVRRHHSVLDTFTFDVSDTVNEHERLYQFERVQRSLDFASSASCLRSWLDGTVIIPNYQHYRSKALQEIDDLGNSTQTVLLHFPTHPSDFPVLRCAVGNLETVATAFQDHDPSMAATARKHVHATEKRILTRLQEVTASNCRDHTGVVATILSLKRASREVPKWGSGMNAAIDHCLDQGARLSMNAGRFLLTLSLELRSMEGADAPIARQLIAEHKSFEWAVNAIFNAATARQGIDYVIDHMQLSRSAGSRLKLMYEAFEDEYNALLDKGFPAVQTGDCDEFLGSLAVMVEEIASDMTLGRMDQAWLLSAYLFAYWTLDNASSLSTLPEGMDDFSTYLKKPHAPQVTAIWLLLGVLGDGDGQKLENHLVELKTGEGKSVVLGIASTILALWKVDVTVICYSFYLSQRDFSDFRGMFETFGVASHIRYSTADGLVEDMMSRTGDVRKLTLAEVTGSHVPETSSVSVVSNQQVLLVDEVDVFFKDEFFGKTYLPAAFLRSVQVEQLVSFIWNNRNGLDRETLLLSKAVNDCVKTVGPKFSELIRNESLLMLRDAQSTDSWHPYVVSEDRIGYKHFDGLTFSESYGYETMFAYLREFDNGKISFVAVQDHLGILIQCGTISFAELPTNFDYIMGVSGTVAGLSAAEKDIISEIYDIKRSSLVPSAYGENQLEFRIDDPNDEFFLELRNEIHRRRKPRDNAHGVRRAVMVFFASTNELLEFYNSKPMEDLRRETRVITETVSSTEKRSAFAKATEQGAITLLIRDFGRGTDFKCFDTRMLDAGGTHVIQAFYSPDLAEEVQIRGRTARQGAKGSYSLVLNFEQLARDLRMSTTEYNRMKKAGDYGSLLYQKRDSLAGEKNYEAMQTVQQLESLHYRTLAFLESLARGHNPSGVRQFLLEQNGVGSLTEDLSFMSNNMKSKFVAERKSKIAHGSVSPIVDVVSFFSRNEVSSSTLPDNPEARKTNYYELLHLPRNASSVLIRCSVRVLCAINRRENNTSFGAILKKAESILLDGERRSVYDFMIETTEDSFKDNSSPLTTEHT